MFKTGRDATRLAKYINRQLLVHVTHLRAPFPTENNAHPTGLELPTCSLFSLSKRTSPSQAFSHLSLAHLLTSSLNRRLTLSLTSPRLLTSSLRSTIHLTLTLRLSPLLITSPLLTSAHGESPDCSPFALSLFHPQSSTFQAAKSNSTTHTRSLCPSS